MPSNGNLSDGASKLQSMYHFFTIWLHIMIFMSQDVHLKKHVVWSLF